MLAARDAILHGADDLLVVFGDTPLISAETFSRLRAPLRKGAAIAVLGFRAADPTGYGRLLVEDGRLVDIREQADATPAECAITLCNAGVMAFSTAARRLKILERIGNANKKSEFYLVDAVAIGRAMGLEAVVIETSEDEVRGINTKAQLAEAEAVMQARLRKQALDAGVTLIAPDTVYLAADTTFGNDVTIEPFVVIGPGVTIGDGAVIHSFSHIVQASIGRKLRRALCPLEAGHLARRRRPDRQFRGDKAAILEAGVKVNHLSYIGDAHVGANTNIGAGTITCNYDGFSKHKTIIGEGAFIGTNSSLVAPVKIGNGAYIGSGSVITKEVPDDALAVERTPQVNREGGARRYRELKTKAKTPKDG